MEESWSWNLEIHFNTFIIKLNLNCCNDYFNIFYEIIIKIELIYTLIFKITYIWNVNHKTL